MEFDISRPQPGAVSHLPSPDELSGQRLDVLHERITDSILHAAGGGDDDLLGQIVRAAVSSFVDSRADVENSAAAVAHLLEQIGARQARRGFDATDLAASFRAALVATQKGLVLVVGDLVNRDTLMQLREDLVAYLTELHIYAHAGLVRARRQRAMSPEQRRLRVSAVAYGTDRDSEFEQLAELDGLDSQQPYIALVSTSAAIPDLLRDDPQTISSSSTHEVLVPGLWDVDELAAQLAGQVVVGPASALIRAAEVLALVRQAAGLLRGGAVDDARKVVPCADLLGELVVRGNPVLAELLVEKHLQPLEALPGQRRVDLAELLLNTLETGQSVALAAQDLAIPRQTAFSRLKAARALLGEALRDPSQRLEVIVALRAAIPRWRADLAARGESSTD